jgi:hypothetical protein
LKTHSVLDLGCIMKVQHYINGEKKTTTTNMKEKKKKKKKRRRADFLCKVYSYRGCRISDLLFD